MRGNSELRNGVGWRMRERFLEQEKNSDALRAKVLNVNTPQGSQSHDT